MATNTAIILHQDGTVSEVTYTDAQSLNTLQGAVGGWIESVSGYGFGMDAYANEEGLYTPGLALNQHMARVFGVGIMGNVVIPKVTDFKRKKLAKLGILPA